MDSFLNRQLGGKVGSSDSVHSRARFARLESIDIMRAVAIVFMILCHAITNWAGKEGAPWTHLLGEHILGDFSAPFFTFLVGVSFAISSANKPRSQLLVKGLITFGVGLLFQIFAWGLDCVFDWDILTIIGTALIVLTFFRNYSYTVISGMTAVSILVAPLGRKASNFVSHWGGGFERVAGIENWVPNLLWNPLTDYHSPMTIQDATLGMLFNGFFPIFPWIAFPLIGYMLGRFVLVEKKQNFVFLYSGALVSILGGLALALLSIRLAQLSGTELTLAEWSDRVTASHLAPLAFYPSTTAMLLIQIGFSVGIFTLLHHLIDWDTARKPNRFSTLCLRFSQYSLTIYALHHFILLWPIWTLGHLSGEPEKYLGNLMRADTAFALGILLTLGMYGTTVLWSKYQGKYSLEWGMTQLTNLSIRLISNLVISKTNAQVGTETVTSSVPNPMQ